MKLTKKQIKKIRTLIKKGVKLREIAMKLKINVTTVSYHANEETRLKRIKQAMDSHKNKPLKERQKVYKKRLPYLRSYQKRRYNEDGDFKEKKKKSSRNYYKKHSKQTEKSKGGENGK